MAGISYDEEKPGFKHIILKPQPSRLQPVVKAAYNSIYGAIISNMWYEDDVWNDTASIPTNTTATIYLPVKQPDALVVHGASGLRFVNYDAKREIACFEAVAGTYSFTDKCG